MTGENGPPAARPGVDFTVSPEAIINAKPDAALNGLTSVDCFDLHQRFEAALKDADEDKKPVFQLLSGLTYYDFRPESGVEPFAPVMVFRDGRTLVPGDLLGEQIAELADFAPRARNPGLRARIADVVWVRDRSRASLGFLAVASYCDCVDAIAAGDAVLAHGNSSPYDVHAVELLQRAAVIAHAMGWRRGEFDRLRSLISGLTARAYQDATANGFNWIAKVNLDNRVTEAATIAKWAESLVELPDLVKDPETRKHLWETAARAHHMNRKEDDENRCRRAAGECLVERAKLAQASPMIMSSFLQDAIDYLRPIPETRDRRTELHSDLRRVQPGIRDEMGTFSHEIDLTRLLKEARESVVGQPTPRALLQMMMCDTVPEPVALRDTVIERQKRNPLSTMMPMSVHDHQGRVAFKSPGLENGEESDELHYRFLMAQHRDADRRIAVAGLIDPIRRVVAFEHPVDENGLFTAFEASPFVPLGHEHIFARATLRFVGGEDMEAAALLVPQLENSLRHLLALKGVDTTSIDQNGIQTEASLSQLLDRYRGALEETLTPRYVQEIDLIFNFRGGPSLRNELAHGKISAGAFWDHNVIYGSWLILHLAFVPLLRIWDQIEAHLATNSIGEHT